MPGHEKQLISYVFDTTEINDGDMVELRPGFEPWALHKRSALIHSRPSGHALHRSGDIAVRPGRTRSTSDQRPKS